MTLFHPQTGQVCLKGVESTTNVIFHGWLKQELTQIVNALPQASPSLSPELIQQMMTRPSLCSFRHAFTLTDCPTSAPSSANCGKLGFD
jgi:hypothetical protein